MKFLANENFPQPSIDLIKSSGFEVSSITMLHAGISDHEVISIALQEDLIILTFDKDYGEIIFKENIPNPPSVVFFRYKGDSPRFAGEAICRIIAEGQIELLNRFTVVEETGIRQRNYAT